MTAKRKDEFIRGSDNVFDDIGIPNAHEHLLKARLVSRIESAKRDRGLTQLQLAQVLGVGQPDISKMFAGEFEKYSVERLMRFLRQLDYEVSIVVRRKNVKRPVATIPVI